MSERFGFRKAWGAERLDDGTTRFRLWAPSQPSVGLRLGDESVTLDRDSGGWHGTEVAGLAPGTPYSFIVADGLAVPDPAARAQAGDVHGPSRLVDPFEHRWACADWTGRPWREAVICELHVGTFDPAGDFDGVRRRLDHLARTGITAVELMPVAQFAGERGWGYDGVLPYCPHRAYGGPDGLKRLVDAAHARGLMVLLDVVYNHFGPDGNYLHAYAPEFFDEGRHTPWGAAIRFEAEPVRAFFIENALYWIEEYRLDGLRLDAIDQIYDGSDEHVLAELARRVRQVAGERHVHLATEDERNIVELHPHDADGRPILHTAEWNDDVHHAMHVIATDERQGYYSGFCDSPAACLARGLAEGFCYQGQAYAPWGGKPRGVPSLEQPPTAFVDFLQNHDQIGNRALGERITALTDAGTVELLTAVLLLNPQIPLLFMGEEYGETRPFLFFTDFHGELAAAVREGRRREFKAFGDFDDATARRRIPDPSASETFEASRLDWSQAETDAGRGRRELIRRLLDVRRREIAPRLEDMRAIAGRARMTGDGGFVVEWTMGDGAELALAVNLAAEAAVPDAGAVLGETLYESREGAAAAACDGELPPRSVVAVIRTGTA